MRKGIMCLAFGGTIGMAFVVLACALKQYQNVWWPLFVVVFYFLSLLPRFIASRVENGSGLKDASVFFATGIILSSFALPIVLARATVIKFGAAYLTIAGNVIIYVTLAAYFTMTQSEASYMGAY